MIETALVFLFGYFFGTGGGFGEKKKKAGPAPKTPSQAQWPGVERPLTPAEKKQVQKAVTPFMEKSERDAAAIEEAMAKEGGGGLTHTPKA